MSAPPRRIRVATGVYQRVDRKTGKPSARSFEFTYRDSTGRQIWQKAGGTTKAEAVAERTAIVAALGIGKRIERTKLTVGEVAQLWLESGDGRWRATTVERRQRLTRLYIDASATGDHPIGSQKLRTLDADRIAAWSHANERVIAPSTALYALTVLGQVCRYAVRRGWLAENPVSLLEPYERPRWDATVVDILEAEDFEHFLAHSRSYRPLFEFLAYTGLRIGEALGLRFSDIDSTRKVLHVRQQLGLDRKPKTVKTKAALREVVLADRVLDIIHAQQHARTDALPDDYVFVNKRGNPYEQCTVGVAFRKALAAADLHTSGRFTVHSLRHFYASMLISAGLNVAFVSQQLGHADSATTLRVYAHLFGQAEHGDTARAAIQAQYESLSAPPQPDIVETGVETNGPPPAWDGSSGHAEVGDELPGEGVETTTQPIAAD